MQTDMQYIYELYQTGSFSKAAEKLFITQPALSMAVARVEASIGMPLFDRSTRPITLTRAGKIYIDAIQKTMDLEQDLQRQFEDIRDLKQGKIVIGATHYINSYILAPVLKGFHEEFPGIQIEIEEGSAKDMAQLLKERKIDLTLNCDPQTIVGFSGYPAFSDTVLLAVPAENPVNQKYSAYSLRPEDILVRKHLDPDCPSISLKAFQNEEFILLREGNNLYERSMDLFLEADIQPQVRISLSQMVTAFHLAASGFAATFISDRLIRDADVKLLCYKIDSPQIYRRFYALLNTKRYISNAVQAFIEYLQDCLK